MSEYDTAPLVAKELVALGQQRGLDLAPLLIEAILFFTPDRFIFFWRVNEKVRYSCQGRRVLPSEGGRESEPAVGGIHSEAGVLDDLEQAFELLKAWLIDGKEVSALPRRVVTTYRGG
jgi:hypothetical protein